MFPIALRLLILSASLYNQFYGSSQTFHAAVPCDGWELSPAPCGGTHSLPASASAPLCGCFGGSDYLPGTQAASWHGSPACGKGNLDFHSVNMVSDPLVHTLLLPNWVHTWPKKCCCSQGTVAALSHCSLCHLQPILIMFFSH